MSMRDVSIEIEREQEGAVDAAFLLQPDARRLFSLYDKVEFNTTTGSLLIRYNPASIDVDRLIHAGRENHFFPEDHSLDIESARKILTGGLNPFSRN